MKKVPKNLKALVCLPMAALMLLCGCHPETSSQIEETVVTTEEPTTVEPTTKPVATADSANVKKYDFLAIKQKNGEITSDFNDIVSAKKFKGVIYAKLGNDFEYISSTGASDNAKHKYNSINTCFYVGGLTQQVTAAAVLLLAEDDKLSLNDTIDAYFPDYAYGADITVQNLLDMTSGIKSYILRTDISDMAAYPAIDLGDKLSKDNSYEENKSAVLDWIFRQELDFEPSEAFAISDSNYYLLGEIIAKASGESYESYVKSHLFKPLAMNNTGFEENDRLAAPFDEGAETDKLTFAGVGYSACGMISNMSDILRWSDGIFTDGVLSEKSVKLMQEESENSYSCGATIKNGRLSSSGRCGAYSALLSFTPDKSDIFISLSNYNYSDPYYLHSAFRNYLARFAVS